MNRVTWNNVLFDEEEEKLIFVDQAVTTIPDAIVNLYHSRAQKLDLSFNQLTSLDGLELFTRLDELILDNNHLGDYIKIPKTHSIKTLSMNNNKIANLNILIIKLSAFLPNIEYLSLLGNPVCPNDLLTTKTDYQSYRTHSKTKLYSPLPDSFRAAGEHRGIYTKCRYRYIGDQSEGNRYISNKDL